MMTMTAFASSTPLFVSTTGKNRTNLTTCRPCRQSLPFSTHHCRTSPSTAHVPFTPRASAIDGENVGLSSPDFVERIRAATAMTSSEATSDLEGTRDRVVALLPVARNDSHSQVRFVALAALAAQPVEALSTDLETSILEVCRDILADDKEPSCRCGAADAIAALRLNDGFDDLVAAYNAEDSDWMLRLSIAAGIGEMRNEKSYEMLTSIVDPEGEGHAYAASEPLVLASAIGALGDLGDMRALPLVSALAKEAQDETVRERAVIAVQMLESAASL